MINQVTVRQWNRFDFLEHLRGDSETFRMENELSVRNSVVDGGFLTLANIEVIGTWSLPCCKNCSLNVLDGINSSRSFFIEMACHVVQNHCNLIGSFPFRKDRFWKSGSFVAIEVEICKAIEVE